MVRVLSRLQGAVCKKKHRYPLFANESMISIATNGVGVLGLGSSTPKQELMEVKGTLLGTDHQLQQLEFHLSGVKSHIH